MLGEFFRCRYDYPDGTSAYYVAEQVSHHPPISAWCVQILVVYLRGLGRLILDLLSPPPPPPPARSLADTGTLPRPIPTSTFAESYDPSPSSWATRQLLVSSIAWLAFAPYSRKLTFGGGSRSASQSWRERTS